MVPNHQPAEKPAADMSSGHLVEYLKVFDDRIA